MRETTMAFNTTITMMPQYGKAVIKSTKRLPGLREQSNSYALETENSLPKFDHPMRPIAMR